ALGMRVLAVRRRLHPGDDPARIFPVTALHDLLPRADVLIIAVPHTDETTGLIGAAELALLPPKAILVNVARGPVVEQGALYRALREGRLHAAGLDVWYRYPSGQDAGYGAANARAHTPPADYPFHELDNVVMSPHRAGGLHTEAVERARMDDLAQLLNAAARGEPLPNPVGVERGY
ncbi:MAG: hydroxyacid dehydrogenase, partial [Anaerolineae bacterium]|nr:hydroxyacid dehydrogenase [Anaerolineae bacterium]